MAIEIAECFGPEAGTKDSRKVSLEGTLSVGEAAEKLAVGSRESVRVIVPSSRYVDKVAGRLASTIAADSAEVYALIQPDSIRWRSYPTLMNCGGKLTLKARW